MTLKKTLHMAMKNNTNVLVDDIKALKTMFNGVTNLGFPFLWDGNSNIYSKEEYMNKLKEKGMENLWRN